MTSPDICPIRDLEDAGAAYERVRAEIEAIDPNNLSAFNVDVMSAASVALGVVPRIMTLRERAARLPEFEIRCIDRLADYAKAAWYLAVTNLPPVSRADSGSLVEQVLSVRTKLLVWAEPLVTIGIFSREAVDKIKEGQGHKDAASDVVALVALYRSVWDEISSICGVKVEDLDRGAKVGPALFAMLSRKDHEATAPTDQTMRLRKAWTLLDRAYQQCQRAVGYFRFSDGDVDTFAPSLRKNQGPRSSRPTGTTTQVDATVPLVASAEVTGPALGGGGGPFVG